MNTAFAIVATLATAAVAVAIPIVATLALVALLRRFAPEDFYALPVLKRAGYLAGLLLGLALVALDPGFAAFSFGKLFSTGSAWDRPYLLFLLDRFFSPAYGLGNLIAAATGGGNGGFRALLWSAAALFVLCLSLPFRFWPARAALSVAACTLAVALWSAFVSVYVLVVAGWSLHALNFWAFAAIGLIYQRYRNRVHFAA